MVQYLSYSTVFVAMVQYLGYITVFAVMVQYLVTLQSLLSWYSTWVTL